MKWILRVLGLLVLVLVLVFAIGFALPAHTTHTRTIILKQPPEKVFDTLVDIQGMPKWNRNMEKVELLAPVDGKETTRQTFKGGMVMMISTAESSRPSHVRALGDVHGPFTGSWTYEITPTPDGGLRVVLTEESQIGNPFFRLMVKFFDPTKYMDEHFQDLAKNFGETATIL